LPVFVIDVCIGDTINVLWQAGGITERCRLLVGWR
jgi:hypothetical protein